MNLSEIVGIELNNKQKSLLKGGDDVPINQEEYCNLMCTLFHDNWENWSLEEQESFVNAWYKHCNPWPCEGVPTPY